MTQGYLHALVEDAAREAGVTVAQMLGPHYGREPGIVHEAKRAAIMRAVEAGYSREQIGRAFKRTKRTIVRTVTAERSRRVHDIHLIHRQNPATLHGQVG